MQICGYGEMLSGFGREEVAEHTIKKHGGNYEIIKVPVFRLETILIKYNINHIDFCSIDVEGNELNVVKSVDFDKFSHQVRATNRKDLEHALESAPIAMKRWLQGTLGSFPEYDQAKPSLDELLKAATQTMLENKVEMGSIDLKVNDTDDEPYGLGVGQAIVIERLNPAEVFESEISVRNTADKANIRIIFDHLINSVDHFA